MVLRDKAKGESAEWECGAVAVCSGLHVTPNIPAIPGIERIPQVFHSSSFKSREQFGIGKSVLSIGSGDTGADLAYLAVTSPTKRVVMCHRDGFHLAPERNLNPTAAVQIYSTQLISTHLCVTTTGFSGRSMTSSSCDLVAYHWDSRRFRPVDRWLFLNKSAKIASYLCAPYRDTKSVVQQVRSSLLQIRSTDTKGRCVDLAPLPNYTDEAGVVVFEDNGRPEYQRMKDERIKPDVVVFCTGYKQVFPFFDKQAASGSSNRILPYPTPSSVDVRGIWKRSDPSIGFIGFVRPSLGAIPPISEMQAQLWILRIAAPTSITRPLLPGDEPHYRLKSPKSARIQYGVDHESYVYQLALDIDSALGFSEVVSLGWKYDWRLPLVWALSANLNAKFRVRGPWQCDGAKEVMKGEMWHMICRRRLFLGKCRGTWCEFSRLTIFRFIPIVDTSDVNLWACYAYCIRMCCIEIVGVRRPSKIETFRAAVRGCKGSRSIFGWYRYLKDQRSIPNALIRPGSASSDNLLHFGGVACRLLARSKSLQLLHYISKRGLPAR
ncbi:hypothetical protein LTR78_006004 [Recurvomyces mirabilis]|uniref:Uncharacterized protein n=1 Tax=Recurvomyces mirabilis TaxID=574656 RepID=A0AAE0WLZ9_9PEZI|nr:hypothetical protein LTR78_006004 [Recurvomyces mirabilis]